jgi:hypothetical protein
MTDVFELKSSGFFTCASCDYITCRQSQYSRHILTYKHKNTDKILTNTDAEGSKSSAEHYSCNCGKKYKHRQSLFNHRKKCPISQEVSTNHDKLVDYLMKENSEFKHLILEALKNIKKRLIPII